MVIPGVLFPAGRITSTQLYKIMGRLKELNPTLQLSPRYPSYFASLHQTTRQAPLRVSLVSTQNGALPKIKVDTPEGTKEVQALPYRRRKTNEEEEYLEDGYQVIYRNPGRPRFEPGTWGLPGIVGCLKVRCNECRNFHYDTCVTCKDYEKHHPGK